MSANTNSVREDFFEEKLSGKEFFAMFNGIAKTVGSLVISDGKLGLELLLSDKALAFYLIERLSSMLGCELKIDRESTEGISQGRYILNIPDPACFELLKQTDVVEMSGNEIVELDRNASETCPDKLLPYFLRGVFWAKGNLFAPDEGVDEPGNKGACRLEIGGLDPDTAKTIRDRLQENVIGLDGCPVSIKLNLQEKGKYTTLYSASMETICNLLAFMGATKTVPEFNALIMVRQLRNSTNRQANCDFGNAVRTSEAGSRQTDAIYRLQQSELWSTLDDKLTEVAMLRLNNAEATVRELAEKTGLSRSGVYHRLARLEELAESLDK